MKTRVLESAWIRPGRWLFSATREEIDFLRMFARHGIGPFKAKAFSVFVETGRH